MKQKNKFEIFSFYIIPQVRAEVVFFLKKDGFSGKEIAEMLNVTESCISQIINKKRASEKIIITDEDKKKVKELIEIAKNTYKVNSDSLFEIIWSVAIKVLYRDYIRTERNVVIEKNKENRS